MTAKSRSRHAPKVLDRCINHGTNNNKPPSCTTHHTSIVFSSVPSKRFLCFAGGGEEDGACSDGLASSEGAEETRDMRLAPPLTTMRALRMELRSRRSWTKSTRRAPSDDGDCGPRVLARGWRASGQPSSTVLGRSAPMPQDCAADRIASMSARRSSTTRALCFFVRAFGDRSASSTTSVVTAKLFPAEDVKQGESTRWASPAAMWVPARLPRWR
mmetsp:Transcript_20494/g.63336  ORF Transcript_20494/g.63336 Transcript_20494/m.63336 type:complete len:215 (-) Transcript_20494:830-1474(-)